MISLCFPRGYHKDQQSSVVLSHSRNKVLVRMMLKSISSVTILVMWLPWTMADSAPASANMTSFWVIADVPYSPRDRVILDGQIPELASNVDFLIHLGDIKSERIKCGQAVLNQMDDVLKRSPVPVFLILGDNEFNDCIGIPQSRALDLWRNTFARYDVKYWTHDFKVDQMVDRPEVFSFVNKRTLFIGLNMVGGDVHDYSEWNDRLVDQLAWVQNVMTKNKNLVHSVVIFGHADPGARHARFFNPLARFLRTDFPTNIPILYLCGDAHKWGYNPGFFKVDNSLRVRLTGGTREPVVKITVDPDQFGSAPVKAFKVDRFL